MINVMRLMQVRFKLKLNGLNSFSDLISFVKDRPGHDVRYAIDASKIEKEIKWTPKEGFDSGIKKTISWYLNNKEWCRSVQNGNYKFTRQGEI